jgi:hypothetical protein
MNYSLGYAYVNGIVVSAEGLDMFRQGATATGGRMIPSGNLFTQFTGDKRRRLIQVNFYLHVLPLVRHY